MNPGDFTEMLFVVIIPFELCNTQCHHLLKEIVPDMYFRSEDKNLLPAL